MAKPDAAPNSPASAPHPGPTPSADALAALWRQAGLPAELLAQARLPGSGPVMASSFNIATAAQASLAAAALAAVLLGQHRGGPRQTVSVERSHALLECSGHFTIDGQVPPIWDPLSGLYPAGADTDTPGWVRIHANFAHHRDAALRVLGLPAGGDHAGPASREQVGAALRRWPPLAFEAAATAAGGVVAAARSFAEWDGHAQARALRRADAAAGCDNGACPVQWIRLGDAPPLRWPELPAAPQPGTAQGAARPLHGLRVLDLTRILAGPVAARLLAGYGADVLMVNGPQLPNIAHIADLSRGKLSSLIDLRSAAGRNTLGRLVEGAQVLLQGYRPGALAALGFSPQALAQRRPGIVVASLSAYGEALAHFDATAPGSAATEGEAATVSAAEEGETATAGAAAGDGAAGGGPWAGRRGFDSLVQTATGFNLAEAAAFGCAQPRALPVQVLDYCAGHLLAFGIQAALWRQATQGGSWQVRVSLAGVGHWLRTLGRVGDGSGDGLGGGLGEGLAVPPPSADSLLEDAASGFGALRVMRHAAEFSATPAAWPRPAMPPGSHPPAWPDGGH